MKTIQALFFDFDGTLLDPSGERHAVVATCHELAALHPHLDPERLLEANGEVWSRYWPSVVELWELGRLDGETLSTEAWRQTLNACGCNDPGAAREARETHVRQLEKSLHVYADAPALFSSLGRCYSHALVTNGASDTQRAKLRLLDVEKHFDAMAISGEIGVAKPDPGIFWLAMRKLGVEPKQVWHVGDNPSTDIAGAHAAGATAVWLNREGREWNRDLPPPDHEIASLDELPPLLVR